MEKKKGNGLLVFLLIVILAMGGFILYDKILKEKYFSNNTNEVKDDDDEKEENITERESADKKDADELYQEYLVNLKKNIDKTYNNFIPANVDEYEFSKNHDEYNYGDISNSCVIEEIEETKSCVGLSDGKLVVIISDGDGVNKNFDIDQNVLQYYLVEEGNGGYHYLYYIKENGKVYMSNVEGLMVSNDRPKETALKNIVGVIPSAFGFISGWGQAIFVDIEGNLYRLDENNKVIEL